MRVAFVHDWLVSFRGGEKVLESLLKLYPNAPIYTMFFDEQTLPHSITSRQIIYSKALNKLKKIRKLLLPLYPAIIESFDLNAYDLIISTSSCVAKGVVIPPHAKHISYIHSPMRYIWDQRSHYLSELQHIPFASSFINLASPQLRMWDVSSNNGVDQFIANSSFVKQRIRRFYGRESQVIHPPVNVEECRQRSITDVKDKGDYFLACGAFVSYKRFDLAIKACERAGVALVVAGSGPLEKRLRKIAPANCRFSIRPSRSEWLELLSKAKALLYPGTEDFGIVPIEAMASGTPVIAHKSGGALDYIKPGINGEFFDHQTVDSLQEALKKFQWHQYNLDAIKDSTQVFDEEHFLEKFSKEIHKIIV